MVNKAMKTNPSPVFGRHAPSVRLTTLAAALIAFIIALPAGLILALIDWLWL